MNQDNAGASAERWDFDERRKTIRQKRKELGLSQVRLAKLAGVHVFTINRFEAGIKDVKPKTLAKIEDALTDAIAAQRMTQTLRAQRQQIDFGPLSQMAPPPPGSEGHRRAREDFVEQGTTTMTQLAIDNSRLAEQTTLLQQQIVELKNIVSILQEQAHNWEEACTLQGEVIRQFQEKEKGSGDREVEALLKRARLAMTGKGK
jgi:transcriptional regulator with XRE-family HTH domain